MSQLISMVEAVTVVDSLQRKPEEYRYQTFFGKYDLWQFIAVVDDRTCSRCMDYDTRFYLGNEIRTEFPYMVIIDEKTIMVYVHPNCRCYLNRITFLEHYIPVIEAHQE